MTERRVFCIGFHKTGTSSMGRALSLLGYRVCGPVEVRNPDLPNAPFQYLDRYLAEYEAFQDNPWPILFRELHERYPDAMFIHTVRDEEGWVASVLKYFGHQETPMRKWIYGEGSPAGNEELYRRRFVTHNEDVAAFFGNSPKYLRVDLTTGEGWAPICSFLRHAIPDIPFPHVRPKSHTRE